MIQNYNLTVRLRKFISYDWGTKINIDNYDVIKF